MINIWDLLVIKPLTFIINAIYSVVPNYGWTIILFTLAVKLILIPLNIKSQRAMKKQQKIQPVIAELQKKYANDKEKLNDILKSPMANALMKQFLKGGKNG